MDCGEWVTITEVENYGGTAEQMYISVSLPDNPSIENIQMVYHNLDEGYILPVGTEVWGDYGTTFPIDLKYPLVEAYCVPWEAGQAKTLQFKVRAEKAGLFRFFVKTTAETNEHWTYDPSSGVMDQQNEYVYVYEINVRSHHKDLIQQYFPYFIFDEEEECYPTNFLYDDDNITNNADNYNETWPYYTYVHTVETEDHLCIQYWFYYCRDDKLWGLEIPFGAHDHDWESVYVYLEKQNDDYIPAYVFYFRHMVFEEPEFVDFYVTPGWDSETISKMGTNPVVYVARDSHASYEKTTYNYGIFFTEVPGLGGYIPIFAARKGSRPGKKGAFYSRQDSPFSSIEIVSSLRLAEYSRQSTFAFPALGDSVAGKR